jgi:hypothetical protein
MNVEMNKQRSLEPGSENAPLEAARKKSTAKTMTSGKPVEFKYLIMNESRPEARSSLWMELAVNFSVQMQ